MTDRSRIRVWDLPLRLFHWLLAACVGGAIVTAKIGGTWMIWHERLGTTVLALLVFRLVWGIVGPRHARFASFVRGPRAVLAWLRHPPQAPAPGHNPLGALSVLAMLLALGLQATTGLFANDDIAFEGPLAASVSNATSSLLTGWHRLNEPVVLGLIALHLAAIVWYRVRRGKNLVGTMIHGDADAAATPGALPSRDDASIRLLALALAAACAAAVIWLVNRGPA